MSSDLYKVYDYPKQGYVNDEPLQLRLTARAQRVDGQMKVVFIIFIALFVLVCVSAFAGFILFVPPFIAFAFLLVPAGLFYVRPPRCFCTTCGGKMKKDFQPLENASGRTGEFLICTHCRRFVFTHRSLR
jgi:hypothetical protein